MICNCSHQYLKGQKNDFSRNPFHYFNKISIFSILYLFSFLSPYQMWIVLFFGVKKKMPSAHLKRRSQAKTLRHFWVKRGTIQACRPFPFHSSFFRTKPISSFPPFPPNSQGFTVQFHDLILQWGLLLSVPSLFFFFSPWPSSPFLL